MTVAAAVLGCGAVGLAMARLLQRRGWRVRIYARDLPPETTSNIAGPQWLPFFGFPGDRVTPEFEAQYLRACRLAHLIEPPVYLAAMLHDFLTAGGQLVVREIRDQAELMSLPEPVMFNCTGLGSRSLFQDEELTPVKGQLSFLPPQPEVDYIVMTDDFLYMYPRQDGILVAFNTS